MKISFTGTGYVGLTSALLMSSLGHEVLAIDTDTRKIIKLKDKILPIYEPGLENYMEEASRDGRIKFFDHYPSELSEVQAAFIAVGTPQAENGSANLDFVFDSAKSLSLYLPKNAAIIIKSTVPPGTAKRVQELLAQTRPDLYVISNPEFLREGSAIYDFLKPDRIVVGISSAKERKIVNDLYASFIEKEVEIVYTDLNSAELIKYSSNSFLANKIAFINEISDLCETIGADIGDVARGVGLDQRIGKDFLAAGPGFGGSCFPKDILALQYLTKSVNCQSKILDAVVEANETRVTTIFNKIKKSIGSLSDKKITFWGVTYKAETDDIRSSPALKLIELMLKDNANICVYDPEGMENLQMQYGDRLIYAESPVSSTVGSHAIVIITEWPIFKDQDLEVVKNNMDGDFLFDLRRILVHKENAIKDLGFDYYFLGRKK